MLITTEIGKCPFSLDLKASITLRVKCIVYIIYSYGVTREPDYFRSSSNIWLRICCARSRCFIITRPDNSIMWVIVITIYIADVERITIDYCNSLSCCRPISISIYCGKCSDYIELTTLFSDITGFGYGHPTRVKHITMVAYYLFYF